jgi:hypothetical protein
LWVTSLYADGNGGSVTVLSASTGRWIRTMSGGCSGFFSPPGIAVIDGRVLVANSLHGNPFARAMAVVWLLLLR